MATIRNHHMVTLAGTDAPFPCVEGESVLRAMERLMGAGRVRLGDKRIPVGCRQGGCGVCRVRVLSGPHRTGPTSRAHVTAAEEAEGYALACRLFPEGDVTVVSARACPKTATAHASRAPSAPKNRSTA